MTTLEERFLSSYPILAGLGRADAEGTPLGNPTMEAIAPDQWRIICEACFGFLWNRPGLTMEQRSLATMSTLVALRRDDNLHMVFGKSRGALPLWQGGPQGVFSPALLKYCVTFDLP